VAELKQLAEEAAARATKWYGGQPSTRWLERPAFAARLSIPSLTSGATRIIVCYVKKWLCVAYLVVLSLATSSYVAAQVGSSGRTGTSAAIPSPIFDPDKEDRHFHSNRLPT
jgi:hypothetical protein